MAAGPDGSRAARPRDRYVFQHLIARDGVELIVPDRNLRKVADVSGGIPRIEVRRLVLCVREQMSVWMAPGPSVQDSGAVREGRRKRDVLLQESNARGVHACCHRARVYIGVPANLLERRFTQKVRQSRVSPDADVAREAVELNGRPTLNLPVDTDAQSYKFLTSFNRSLTTCDAH